MAFQKLSINYSELLFQAVLEKTIEFVQNDFVPSFFDKRHNVMKRMTKEEKEIALEVLQDMLQPKDLLSQCSIKPMLLSKYLFNLVLYFLDHQTHWVKLLEYCRKTAINFYL